MLTGIGSGQQPPDNANQQYCATISSGLRHSDAFQQFCEWVVSFDTKLPNIIGDQQTYRYHTDNGRDLKLRDTTSARLAYIDNQPHFSDVAINRVKVADDANQANILKLHGAWSYDDFGGALRLLFGSNTRTRFVFAEENTWNGIPVFVFGYEVLRADNQRWEMKTMDRHKEMVSDFPGYKGRIILDSGSHDLLHFDRESTEVDKHFPLRYGSNQVNYKRVPLGDGTYFVLPVEAIVKFCHDDKRHNCEVNDTTFQHWQKFGAKSRILTGAEPPQ
jgi:hypothetical protein